MLTNHKKLAKTSSTPGKTQLINHFLINKDWYMVDLPGYGYAKTSKKDRKVWSGFIKEYLTTRKNLSCVFVLLDSRHKPQKIDLEFMAELGLKRIPFAMVFTKIDKISSSQLNKNIKVYKNEMLKTWDSLPKIFYTSSASKLGSVELLSYVDEVNEILADKFKD